MEWYLVIVLMGEGIATLHDLHTASFADCEHLREQALSAATQNGYPKAVAFCAVKAMKPQQGDRTS